MQYLLPITLCLILIFNISLFAQYPHPLDFFPHHQGDVWEYWYDEWNGNYVIEQNRILLDSLGNDGRYYIETEIFSDFVVDTSSFEVYGNIIAAINNVLAYKLDADSGDTWIGWRNGTGAIKVDVIDVFEALLFNQYLTTVKVYSYSDSAFGLWVGTHYLANGFGLIRIDTEFSSPEYIVKGAIIDSTLYGTVTAIKPENSIFSEFTLYDNYPNPFNPSTTIKYHLNKISNVKLTVYDILGKKVRTLVSAWQTPGLYRVQFDAKGLTSGMYIYELNTGKHQVRKKMLLVK